MSTKSVWAEEAITVSTFHGFGDPCRVTMPTLRRFLALVYEEEDWNAFWGAILLVATGIEPDRLAGLEVLNGPDRDTDYKLCFSLTARCLSMLVQGRVKQGKRTVFAAVNLTLPVRLTNFLTGIPVGSKPFQNLEGRINAFGRKLSRTRAGQPVTAIRLGASHETLFAVGRINRIEQGLLTGKLRRDVQAPAHYWHQTARGLQRRFNAALVEFAADLRRADSNIAYASWLTPSATLEEWHQFVIEHKPASRYAFSDGAREIALEAQKLAASLKKGSCAEMSQLIAYINLQQCNLFLLSQLFEFRRSPAPGRAPIRFGLCTWLADKDSAQYKEGRLLPPSHMLEEQVDACNATLGWAAKFSRSLGFEFDVTFEGVPLCVEITNGRVVAARMSAKVFRFKLLASGVAGVAELEPNFGRHFLCTTFGASKSEQEIESLLGHWVGAHSGLGAHSLVSWSDLCAFVAQVEEHSSKLGIGIVPCPI